MAGLYRKLWVESFGEIPKDDDGRSFEIHHINADKLSENYNDLSNLMCISIKEHYDIHYKQGDYGACSLIAKRMELSPEEISKIQRGCNRPGIGGVKKGTVPWNKGLVGAIHISEELRTIRSINSTGENNSKSKLTEIQVEQIITLYLSRIDVPNIGVKRKNGKEISYEWAFSEYFSKQFNITPSAINRILKRKAWKYVWDKF